MAWGEPAGKTASGDSEQAVSDTVSPVRWEGAGQTDARLRGTPSQLATLLSCRDLDPPCMARGRSARAARRDLGMQAPPSTSCIRTRFRTGSPRTHVAVASWTLPPSAEEKVYSPQSRALRASRGPSVLSGDSAGPQSPVPPVAHVGRLWALRAQSPSFSPVAVPKTLRSSCLSSEHPFRQFLSEFSPAPSQ